MLTHVLEQDMGDIRRDDEFHATIREHHPRHAVRQAAITRIVALAAAGLVRKTRIENGLILGGERSLLAGAAWLIGAQLPILDHSPFQSGYIAASEAAARERGR